MNKPLNGWMRGAHVVASHDVDVLDAHAAAILVGWDVQEPRLRICSGATEYSLELHIAGIPRHLLQGRAECSNLRLNLVVSCNTSLKPPLRRLARRPAHSCFTGLTLHGKRRSGVLAGASDGMTKLYGCFWLLAPGGAP